MNIQFADLIVWLVLGALAGPLVGALVKRTRQGFGLWINLGIGMVGALIGGALFTTFGILESWQQISIDLQDVAASVVGSLLFLLLVRLYQSKIKG